MERLREAARLADLPLRERLRHLDPRAVSSRSAALGRVVLPEPPEPPEPAQLVEPAETVEPPPSHRPGDTGDLT
jgi:hypothetical protein